jgi:GT2 family glycosyltransferase
MQASPSVGVDEHQAYPLVSVVLLNYNGIRYLGSLLKECLDSVLKTDYPNFEVIFVDNGSTDGSDVYAREFFENAKHYKNLVRFSIVHNKSNVIATGYNQGIKSSRGKYIALLSNDMVYDLEWLRRIIEAMERDPHVGIAGCKRFVYGTLNVIDGLGGNLCLDGRPMPPGHLKKDVGQYEIPEEMDWIGGAAVVKREVFQKIGVLDADYTIFYEDTDLCYRARKNGYRVIYVPKAKLWHNTTSTISNALASSDKDYMGERSRIRFIIIHFTLQRMLSAFAIDLIAWFLVDSQWKRTLSKAYWWNLLNLNATMMKRLEYGPSPPYGCKYPLFSFSISGFMKKAFKQDNT